MVTGIEQIVPHTVLSPSLAIIPLSKALQSIKETAKNNGMNASSVDHYVLHASSSPPRRSSGLTLVEIVQVKLIQCQSHHYVVHIGVFISQHKIGETIDCDAQIGSDNH